MWSETGRHLSGHTALLPKLATKERALTHDQHVNFLLRLVRALMDPMSPHPLPEVGRHGSPDLLTQGDFDSVEAWLRAEKDAWHYAADHATTRSKQYTFRETANFYEHRLDEHLARRSHDQSQS